MRLFNTYTNKKEEFIPIHDHKVGIYVCGPTVYNYVHVGNTRPMIVFDVLRRILEYYGNEVTFVSNYTDVDDKIIKQAIEEGITEKELTDKYIKAYEDIRDSLNIKAPTYTPRVTQTMDKIIEFIQSLIDKGYAYQIDGDVYFRVPKIKDYGHLSGIRVEDLIEGASRRTESSDDAKKESSLDFALWKKTDEGIRFESPWSKGRPGWHTECVVMINDIFKESKIDIHGGGHDLKFPHHENEIAQSEAYSGDHLANYWVHNQMININGEKMSKSLGNVLWAKDLLLKLGINVYKWLMLSTHYRNPLNFTDEVLNNVKKETAKVENVVKAASLYLQTKRIKKGIVLKEKIDKIADALSDDLNTSLALTLILEEVKVLNQIMRTKEKDDEMISNEYETLMQMTDLIGFNFRTPVLSDEDIDIYNQWNNYKKEKNFEEADRLRSKLMQRGIL
ncbi:cysteine--tRNA ligase [Eggerthia catenaformis]|uniref:cysteine--tRNA ligase n=1 Tax=Eggerthia catenaformis TaxID=31973 RepID=UPI0028E66F3F|nr:cysteine--tRNA ligase [Eggerthia catenaformis]